MSFGLTLLLLPTSVRWDRGHVNIMSCHYLIPLDTSGIMLFREKSMAFVEEWIDIIEKDETVWDQNAFNSLFRK